jgi:hypothetical protein
LGRNASPHHKDEFAMLMRTIEFHANVAFHGSQAPPGERQPFRHLPPLAGVHKRRRVSLEEKEELLQLTSAMSRSGLNPSVLKRSVSLWQTTFRSADALDDANEQGQDDARLQLVKRRRHIKSVTKVHDDYHVPVMWNVLASVHQRLRDGPPSIVAIGADGVSLFGEDILKCVVYLPEPRFNFAFWMPDQVVRIQPHSATISIQLIGTDQTVFIQEVKNAITLFHNGGQKSDHFANLRIGGWRNTW